MLRKYVFASAIADRPLVAIKRLEFTHLLDHIQKEHGARQADAVKTVLSSIAHWYADRIDGYTPSFAKKKRSEATARERTLTDDEIRLLWKAAESSGVFGGIVRLALVTGQRRSKIVSMRWTDLDEAGVWHIPSDKGEKGNGGDLKLSRLALEVIKEQPALGPCVFRAASGGGHARGIASMKEAFDRKLPRDVPGWTLHDLRRTARSLMSRAKADPVAAELVLGHKIGGIAGIYDRYDREAEKTEALQKLADQVKIILAGPPTDNVVPINACGR
jgi:integrase